MKRLISIVLLLFIVSAGKAQQWVLYDTSSHYMPANLVVSLDNNQFISLTSVGSYLFELDSGRKQLGSFNIPVMNGISLYGSQGTLLTNGQVLFTGDSAALYDPQLDVLTPMPEPLQGRAFHSAVRLQNGQVLVAGGSGNRRANFQKDVFASCELFDPSSKSWKQAASLPIARDFSNSVLLDNGKVLLTGGYDSIGNPLKEALLYDPVSNSWSSGNQLHTASCYHALVKLSNGEVLLFRGLGKGGALKRIERYDPIANEWSPAGDLLEHRYGHTATLMPDGSVIIVAGANKLLLKSVERFEPSITTSTVLPPMHKVRSEHRAFLLKNNDLIVIGGKPEQLFHFSSTRSNFTEVFR